MDNTGAIYIRQSNDIGNLKRRLKTANLVIQAKEVSARAQINETDILRYHNKKMLHALEEMKEFLDVTDEKQLELHRLAYSAIYNI